MKLCHNLLDVSKLISSLQASVFQLIGFDYEVLTPVWLLVGWCLLRLDVKGR